MSERITQSIDIDGLQRAFTQELVKGDSLYGSNTNVDAAAECLELYINGMDISTQPQDVQVKVTGILSAFHTKCDELQISSESRQKMLKNVVEILSYGQ
jgi:hypothetical protein